jgi:hypothetical protein
VIASAAVSVSSGRAAPSRPPGAVIRLSFYIKSWAQGQRKRSRECLTRFSLWIKGRPTWGAVQAKRARGALKRCGKAACECVKRFWSWIQGRPAWGKEQAARAARAVKRWAKASSQPIKGMLVLIAGLYFAGLPTYYAIFTVGHTNTTARHDRNLGLWLFLIWVLIALFAGYQALTSDREVLRLLRASVQRQISRRARASAISAIQLMLYGHTATQVEALRDYAPKIYEVDDPERPTLLTPFLDENPPDDDRWTKNEGVLWLGFNDNDPSTPIVITGDDLIRATSALESEQQRIRFGHLTLVAAIVIQDATNHPIGVLSCSSSSTTIFDHPEREAMATLAAELGILLQLAR